MSNDVKQKIYVACSAEYHAGISHGCWITVNDDVDELRQSIQSMLAKSSVPDAKTWVISNSQGFKGFIIDNNEELDSICEKAKFVREYKEFGVMVAGSYNDDLTIAKKILEDYYNDVPNNVLKIATEIF